MTNTKRTVRKTAPMVPDGTKGFAVRFIALCIVFFTGLIVMPDGFYEPINTANAHLTVMVMRGVGFDPAMNGVVLTMDGFAIRVVGECSAVFTIALLIAFVLAYPTGWRHRLIGLGVGIPVLSLFNILRIALVFAIGATRRQWFEAAHVYIGQVMMVGMVVIIVLFWLHRHGAPASDPRSPWTFVARFVIVSVPIFILWSLINDAYLDVNHAVARWALDIQHSGQIRFRDSFLTFNLVAFSGLILAAPASSRRHRWVSLALGAGVLALSHLAFVVCEWYFFALQIQTAAVVITAMLVLNEWVLPVLLFVWFTRHRSWFRSSSGSFIKI